MTQNYLIQEDLNHLLQIQRSNKWLLILLCNIEKCKVLHYDYGKVNPNCNILLYTAIRAGLRRRQTRQPPRASD